MKLTTQWDDTLSVVRAENWNETGEVSLFLLRDDQVSYIPLDEESVKKLHKELGDRLRER